MISLSKSIYGARMSFPYEIGLPQIIRILTTLVCERNGFGGTVSGNLMYVYIHTIFIYTYEDIYIYMYIYIYTHTMVLHGGLDFQSR